MSSALTQTIATAEAGSPGLLARRWSSALVPRLLGLLERLPLGSPRFAAWMIARHQRALAKLLRLLPRPPRTVVVVGGGLFPRTAVALHRLLPAARIVLLDAEATHLDRARDWLAASGLDLARFELVTGRFDGTLPAAIVEPATVDAVVIPLAYVGDRDALYRAPEGRGRAHLVHDWIWRPRGRAGTVVSLLCLKRLNLT